MVEDRVSDLEPEKRKRIVNAALTFGAFFAGAIAVCLVGIRLGRDHRHHPMDGERGWKSPLAQTMPFVIVIKLHFAASGTWIAINGK